MATPEDEAEVFTVQLQPDPPDVEAQVEAARARGETPVITHEADGSVTVTSFKMSDDLVEMLERARAEWKRLEEAGTPYWCVHEGRSVSHPRAFWVNDGHDGIHRKHGVLCADCGGYIQEG